MISGTVLRDAVISGANNIAKHKSVVDKLNIFPVPDGDTGTNMSMTMSAGSKELLKLEDGESAGLVAEKTASSLLRGARGNSGVILSLLFRGFSRGLKGLEEATGADLAEALALGVEAAYKAVMKPTEGTMLTVSRVASEKGKYAASINNDPIYVWDAICKGAAESLETTPELLPVLKKAGVVDAGGLGLCHIFDGMMSVFRDGIIIEGTSAEAETGADGDDFFANAAAEFDDDITFTYCTEFIVGREPTCTKDPLELRRYLESVGDCVVVVDDEEIIKVHVHTEDPGLALQDALTFGQLLTVKVENMKEQHKEQERLNDAAKSKKAKKAEKLERTEPEEPYGFVAVAAGNGLQTLFHDLGCLHVVSGGQTMNPSTEDILEACLATPAKIVYVLPNNKNIIMAAEQAEKLAEDRTIVVVPTRTLPQGITAMLAFNPESEAKSGAEDMMEAAKRVGTGQVTFAARDSEFGGLKMKEGEIIALDNGRLVFAEKDPVKAVVRLVRSMAKKDTEFITLIYGEDVTEADAQEAKTILSNKLGPAVDITLINGSQPVYYFIVSVE